MSSPAAKVNDKNTFLKPSKNIEINMSTLSTAQKQMCIKLLAQSNINFEEANGKDFFEAQLKIDPSKLTSQFNEQKQTQLNVSPIKNQEILRGKKLCSKPKQNLSNQANVKVPSHKKQKLEAVKKKVSHPIYTNSKKSLSKTVKINFLTQLQKIYPFVELYVYPKKMSFQNLTQLIQEIYDLYWNTQINGQKSKQKTQQRDISFDNRSSTFNQNHSKKPYNKHKSIYQHQVLPQQHQQKATFCFWMYNNFILPQKEKIKMQQLLVNFVQSLNHFSYKHLGIQMFYNFLAGTYNLQTLHYFLVIRALLQQIQGQKIIQKVSNYGSKAGVLYKMKLNPYNKFIQEQKVQEFLQVCCCQSSSNSSPKQDQTIGKIFQEMTTHMFFDQKKKKNYIHFFEMVDILLREFLRIETVNTTNLELSYTQEHSSMNDFLFQEQLNAMLCPEQRLQEDLELTFQVHEEQEEEQQQKSLQYQIQQHTDGELKEYLPDCHSRELQIQPKQLQQTSNFQFIFYRELYKRYESIRKSFSNQFPQNDSASGSRQILQALFECVVKGDKSKWTSLSKPKPVSCQRQSQELHFIQRLQIEFQQIKNSNIVSNQFIRKMLTIPYLRETIVQEARISFIHP